ncbi:hypothetical protein FJP65_12230 [Stenotrophomonas maltophilia]|nr:hypothetical protein FJP65_12230 [Stenotrophomonas maltophilia]
MSTSVDTVDPRHAWMLFVQWSKYSISLEIHPRMAWIYHRHRETVEGGVVWGCRTVGAMDGAIEPPWMGLRRVLQPRTAPPNHRKARAGCCCCLGFGCGCCLCRCRAQPCRKPPWA